MLQPFDMQSLGNRELQDLLRKLCAAMDPRDGTIDADRQLGSSEK